MPSTREGAALADDLQHHVVVMFGGNKTSEYRGDTWLWNGSWHQVCPAHSPSPRTGATMTYDPVRHLILLFGGSDGFALNDTWTWDGTDWTKQSPATSPPGRSYARLAFDVARGNAVLNGGFFSLRDTWTWDGRNWKQRHSAATPRGPGDSTQMPEAMAYDPAHKVIVTLEVVPHSAPSSDTMETWTWNGTGWTRLATSTSPQAREGYGLAYDAGHSLVVLAGGFPFGGADSTPTWGWNGVTWSKLDGLPA